MAFGGRDQVVLDIALRTKNGRAVKDLIAQLQELNAVQTAHKTDTVSYGKFGPELWERYSAQGTMNRADYDKHKERIQGIMKSIDGYSDKVSGAGNVTYRVLHRGNSLLQEGASLYDRIGVRSEQMIDFSRKMTWASMSMLGVFFSMMSLTSLMKQGFTALLSPIMDLEETISKIALGSAFAESIGMDSEIFGDTEEMTQRAKDIEKMWEQFNAWQGAITTGVTDLARGIFLDPDSADGYSETSHIITTAMEDINAALTDPETVEALSDSLADIAEVAPDIAESVPGIVSFFAAIGTAKIPFTDTSVLEAFIKIGFIAAPLMAVFSLLNMITYQVAMLSKGLGWIGRETGAIIGKFGDLRLPGMKPPKIDPVELNVKVNTDTDAFKKVMNSVLGEDAYAMAGVKGPLLEGDVNRLSLQDVYGLIDRFDETGNRITDKFATTIDEFGNRLNMAGEIMDQFDAAGNKIVYDQSFTASDHAIRVLEEIRDAVGVEPLDKTVIENIAKDTTELKSALVDMGYDVYEKVDATTVNKYTTVMDKATGQTELAIFDTTDLVDELGLGEVRVVRQGDPITSEYNQIDVTRTYDNIDKLFDRFNSRVKQTLDGLGMDTNYRYQYGQMLSGEMETNAISDINTLKITRHQRQLAETASIRETTNLITQPMRTMDNMPGFVDMGMDFLNKGNVISDLPSQDIYRLLNHLNQLEGLGIQNPYQSYYDFMQGIPTDQNIKVYNPKSGTSYVYEDVADMLNMIRNPTTTAESIRQSFVGGRNAIQIMDPETGDIFKKFGPGQLLKQAQEMQIPPSQYSQEFFNVDNLKAIAINELGIRKMMSDEMYGTPDEEAMLKTNELLEDIADALDSNLQKLNDNLAGTSKTASQQDLTIMLDEASKEIATKWGLDPDKVSDQILDAYTPQEVYNYRTELRGQTIEVPNKAGQEVVDNTVTELADRIYNIRRNVDTGVVDTALEMPEVTKSTYINKETAAQLTESYRNILNVLDIREDMVADFDIQTAKSVPGKISSEGDVFTIQSKGIDYEMLNKAIAEKYNVPEELMESLYLDFYNMPAGKTAAQDMAVGLTNMNRLAETPVMDRTTVIPIEETRVDIRDMLDLDTEDMTGVLDQRASTYGDIADDIARLPELPDMGPMQPAEWIDFEAIESETTPAVTESKRKSIWDWLNFKNKENKAIVEAMDDIDGGLPDDIPSKTTGGIDDLLSNNKGSLFDMNNMEYAGLRTEAGLRANSIDIGLGLTELIANLARTQPVVEATSGIPVVGDVLESTSFETQLTEQETMNKYFYDELQKLGGWDTYANMTYSQQNDVISAAQAAYREDTGEIFTMTPEVTAPQMKMTPEELTAYQNVTGMDPFAQSNAEMSTPFYMIGDMSTAGNTGMLAATGLFWGLGNLYEDYKFGQEGWDRYTPEVSQEMLDISPYAGMTQEAYDLRNVPIEDIWRAIGDRIEGESGQSYYIEESTFRQLAGQRMAREDTYGTAESQQQFIQALEGYDEWLDSEIKNKGSVMDKIFSVPDTFFDIITGSTSNRERNVLGATGETEEELFNRFTQDVLSKIGNGEQVTNVDVNNPTEVNNDTTNNMTFNMTFNIEGDMEEEQSNSVRDNMTEFAKKFANMSLA